MRFRPLLWPTLMTVPMLALAIGLGLWQLERREWKLGLIAEMQERLAAPEQPLADLEKLFRAGGSIAYRRVAAEGRFDHAHELFWFTPGPEGEPGYHIVTPLVLFGGETLLVDRGFIPAELKDAAPGRDIVQATVHGIARESQPGGLFTPKDEPGKGLVFTRDIPRITAELGLTRVLPFFIDADATPNPGGYPLGGQTRVTLRNEHLQYAITWFGLAAALLIVYLVYHRSRGRLS